MPSRKLTMVTFLGTPFQKQIASSSKQHFFKGQLLVFRGEATDSTFRRVPSQTQRIVDWHPLSRNQLAPKLEGPTGCKLDYKMMSKIIHLIRLQFIDIGIDILRT